MGLSDSAANDKSIVWPALLLKSIVNRAKTVSTVLMRPKPQLRCMQNPLLVSCTNASICWRSNLPAEAIFSNSSLIICLSLASPEGNTFIKGRERPKTKRNCCPGSGPGNGRGATPQGSTEREHSVLFGYPTLDPRTYPIFARRFYRGFYGRRAQRKSSLPGRPPAVPGVSVWGYPVDGNPGFSHRPENRGANAEGAIAKFVVPGPLSDFLARTHPQSCGGA